MSQIVIVYYSGYGHTQKQAEAVLAGIEATNKLKATLISISKEGEIREEEWQLIHDAQAIIFGSPTYMAGVAWQFKRFADASSKPWHSEMWKDKLCAGFTNSASMNGDKANTLQYLFALAMQHGMLWLGTGLLPANSKATDRNAINYLGSSSGLMAQSPSDSSPNEGPLPGDLATAKLFGQRIAEASLRWADESEE